MFSACTQLHTLELNGIQISEADVLALLSALPALQDLTLGALSWLGSLPLSLASLSAIGRACPHLLRLEVRGVHRAKHCAPDVPVPARPCLSALRSFSVSGLLRRRDFDLRALVSLLAEHTERLLVLQLPMCEIDLAACRLFAPLTSLLSLRVSAALPVRFFTRGPSCARQAADAVLGAVQPLQPNEEEIGTALLRQCDAFVAEHRFSGGMDGREAFFDWLAREFGHIE